MVFTATGLTQDGHAYLDKDLKFRAMINALGLHGRAWGAYVPKLNVASWHVHYH